MASEGSDRSLPRLSASRVGKVDFRVCAFGWSERHDADARRVVKMLGKSELQGESDCAETPAPGIPFVTPEPARVAAFQDIVRRAVPCFIRKPADLISSRACGQLKRNEA